MSSAYTIIKSELVYCLWNASVLGNNVSIKTGGAICHKTLLWINGVGKIGLITSTDVKRLLFF